MSQATSISETSNVPLHKSAQRLRWFVDAFQKQVAETEAQTGNLFALDTAAMTEAFAEWMRAFEAQKPLHDEDKPAYVGFAAGLMLSNLIRFNPARVADIATDADSAKPAYFWPEGYLYVSFCLNVRGMILEKDYRAEQHPNSALEELRTWWSFRENARENVSSAIAYLDLFAGDEPKWNMPELFHSHSGGRSSLPSQNHASIRTRISEQ